jgi:hypothetical protein
MSSVMISMVIVAIEINVSVQELFRESRRMDGAILIGAAQV